MGTRNNPRKENYKGINNIKVFDFLTLFVSIGGVVAYTLAIIPNSPVLELNDMNIELKDKFLLYSQIQVGLSGLIFLLSIISIVLDYSYPNNKSGKYAIYSIMILSAAAILTLSLMDNFNNTINGFDWVKGVSLGVSSLVILGSLVGIGEKVNEENINGILNNSNSRTSTGALINIAKEIKILSKWRLAIIITFFAITVFFIIFVTFVGPNMGIWPYTKYEFSCPKGTDSKHLKDNE